MEQLPKEAKDKIVPSAHSSGGTFAQTGGSKRYSESKMLQSMLCTYLLQFVDSKKRATLTTRFSVGLWSRLESSESTRSGSTGSAR